MMNSNSLFNVKNAGLFLLLTSILLSFTNPNTVKKSTFSYKETKNSFNSSFKELTKREDQKVIKFKKPDFLLQPNPHVSNQTSNDILSENKNAFPEQTFDSNLIFNSTDNHEGTIGSQNNENWNDDPADNLYNVNLMHYDKNKQYTLVYSVKGVTSASSVTRSINKSFSLGGYIATKGNSWVTIKEDIDPSLINQGNNQILFNTINSNDFYLVKDVSIIESSKKQNSFYKITSKIISNDKIYIKGYFNEDSQVKNIDILGNSVAINNNEFEYFASFSGNQKDLKLKFTKKDGSFIEERITNINESGSVQTNNFTAPEEKIIIQNNFGILFGLRNIDIPPVESSINNVNKNFSGYRFKSISEEKKTIQLPYDKNKIPKGFFESDIATFGFDYLQKKWQRLKIDSIDIEKELVILTVEGGGDTDYVNGIIKNPESPETASFTPTTTNDIPVANPTSKINMISPPTPNQQGSANVSYPIEIPAGINGFQPSISLTYNSDSKTGGWAGIGWDIPLETIDIDTRWGVPEFNIDKESEIYSINGEQLVFEDGLLPNKLDFSVLDSADRNSSGDRQFYFRTGVKEGTKIIRKGTSTQNYTWEITGDDGTVKKYTELLKDNSGKVVKWFLKSVTDVYGNIITYNYDEPTYNQGKNKYLSRIDYSNNTSVEFFNRFSVRSDVTSSYKLGVKISDFKLLEKIEIKRAGVLLREYKFEYKIGDFDKQLLTDIIQKKGSEEFNRHQFDYTKIDTTEYYPGQDIPNDGLLFSRYPQNIISPSDNLTSGSYDKAKMSLISGTQGKSKNWKGALTVGLSARLFGFTADKKGTFGMNYSYGESENFGKSQLMDVDGDGLPDKVFFKDTGSIKYRKNIGSGFSGDLVSVTGFSNYPLSKNNSYINSLGLEASFPGIGGGLTWSDTKSNSPIYFSDVNGDGLSDLAYYGKIYFNKIRLVNNKEYSSFSDDTAALNNTPNTILKGVPAPVTTTPEEESTLLANIVRVWEAPTTGIVDITNLIKLEQNSTDGVDVWMEQGSLTRANENDSTIPSSILGSKVTLNNINDQRNLNASNIPITKGQRIYIIAGSKEKSKGDIVKVNTNITYASVPGITNLNIKDANGYDYFKFNYGNTFLSSDGKPNVVGDKAKININWTVLDNLTFTDDVDFKIYKLEKSVLDPSEVNNNDRVLIYNNKLNRNFSLSDVTPSANLLGISLNNLLVNQTSTESNPKFTYLYFEVSSDTNVAWDKINWKPTIEIQYESDTIQSRASVKYNIFSEVVKNSYKILKNDINYYHGQSGYEIGSPFKIYPKFTSSSDNQLNLNTMDFNGKEITFSIKFKHFMVWCKDCSENEPDLTFKKKVTINNGLMPIPFIENNDYSSYPFPDNMALITLIERGQGSFDNVYFELTSDDYELNKYLATLNPNIYAETSSNSSQKRDLAVQPDYYSYRSETKHYNPTIGNMWQGWGGFAYNASKYLNETLKEQEFLPVPIEEDDVILPNCDPTSADYETCMQSYINNQINNRYFTQLVFDVENDNFSSPLESAFLSKDYMQPYNMFARKPSSTFEGDPIFVTADPRALITHSTGKSLNAYGSFLIGNVSGGYSKDDTSEFFQDFNGDQYPDIIVGDRYYKTNLLGALTDYTIIGSKVAKNKTTNLSVGLSASRSINPEKNSNTLTTGFNSWGELYSQAGSSFSASGANAGITIGGSWSSNENIWLDINGDGMVDYITKEGGTQEVYINNGGNFVKELGWNIGEDVFKNSTAVISGGGGINWGNGSVVLAVGKNFSFSTTKVIFTDINGDGLVDKLVSNDNKYEVFINTGTKISALPTGDIAFEIQNNQNSSGVNTYLSFCPIIFGIKICLSLSLLPSSDKSTNKQTVDLRDFNGDGLPDILVSNDDTQMTVIENQADKFNLLSSITNPLGGNMELKYGNKNLLTQQKLGNTYQMPFTKQALVRLDIEDTESTTNISEYNKSIPAPKKSYNFEYENGVQDRRERSFLGFGKVIIKDKTNITQVTEYETNFTDPADFYVPYNDPDVRKYFYKKGLVRSTYTLDSIGRERQRTNYAYNYFDQTADNYILMENQTEPAFKDIGRIIPFLYKTQTITTEFSGTNSHSKTTTAIINEYDKFGNVTKYTDLGKDVNNTSDDIKVSIAYHPVTVQNVGGIPQQQLVTNSANTVLRKSETAINAKGDVTSIKRFNGSDFAQYNYEYDTHGNLKKSILPKNTGESEANRMFYLYEYDPTYNTYITKISDARGLSSTTTYDTNYLLGVPSTITDTNNAIAYYTYDTFGRLTEYKAPTAASWTIKLYYYKAGDFNSRVAVTEKKAPTVNGVVPTLNYFSSVYVSNWGEELTSKKLYGGTANNYIYTYTKSPLKDIKGRTIKSFINKLATQETGSIIDAMQNFSPQDNQMLNADEFRNFSVIYKYDELDRPIKAIQNGVFTNEGTVPLTTETQYGFGADRIGDIQFTKKTISPKGLENLVYTDEKGRTTATKQIGDNKNLWVSYSYDLLNQLTEVKDQNSNKMEFTYDQLGRRITEKHPDAGLMTYEYDLNNNLIYMDNPVLRNLNQKVGYQYKFNQLTEIVYPDYSVIYEYGFANDGNNGAGRLIKQTDHTGIQFFKYNQLGQIVENRRFMVAPDVDAKLFKTSYTYDLFNRINKIIYPDNEEVFYNYTAFGLLNNLKSKAPGTTTQELIISDILYNYNEQTLETTAGNGTKTQYDYDSWGRLEEMALQGTTAELKKNQYLFDKDNNISTLTTAVPMSGNFAQNDISIRAEKTFEYDGFNRLKKSTIKAIGKTGRKFYQLDMAYTDMHGISNKDSRWKEYSTAACQNPISRGDKMVYNYEDLNHPNAVSSIEFNSPNSGGNFTTPWDCGSATALNTVLIKEFYTYDENGNMTKIENGAEPILGDVGTEPVEDIKRKLFWDAQNRLKGITEQNAFHHYVYDEDGQRALKSEGASRKIKSDGNNGSEPESTIMGSYNYYPNGYMVMNEKQVSKHYYIGSNKIAARVSETPSHGFLAPSNSELSDLSGILKIEAENIVAEAGLNPIQWHPIFIGGIDFESEEICAANILAEAEKYPPKSTCFKKLTNGYNAALISGGRGSFCTFWHNFQLDDCMADQPTEQVDYQTYWVHPDHLGSSSVITNQSGTTTNWYEYMPFGEILMEQNNNSYNNPYKYNGKELDEATGLYYYGARYMDPKTSIWLSVDPLAVYNPVMETEFYGDGQHNGGVFYSGNLNPYIYTYQNPIRYIDPNGKQTEAINGYLGKLWNDWSPSNRANKRMSGESERDQNRRLAESTLRNVNGVAKTLTTKQTAKDLLHIATRNPDQKLLKLADVMQDTGDAMSIAGYALTVSVVGAELGVPLAALGETVSTAGDAIQITVELSQADVKGATDAGWLVAGKLIDAGISKIPGITNKQAKTVRENLSKHILKQGAGIKLEAIKKATENNSEKKK